MQTWSREKKKRYWRWALDKTDSATTAARAEQLLQSIGARKVTDPNVYKTRAKSLNFFNDSEVCNFVIDTQDPDIRPQAKLPLPPIFLFKYGANNFYLYSEIVDYENEDELSNDDKINESQAIYPAITKFKDEIKNYVDPCLMQPPVSAHLPLKFGLLLGTLRYGPNTNPSRASDLSVSPFLVFLHTIDHSIWIIFNYYKLNEEEEIQDIFTSTDNNSWQETGLTERTVLRTVLSGPTTEHTSIEAGAFHGVKRTLGVAFGGFKADDNTTRKPFGGYDGVDNDESHEDEKPSKTTQSIVPKHGCEQVRPTPAIAWRDEFEEYLRINSVAQKSHAVRTQEQQATHTQVGRQAQDEHNAA